jgi:CRISPR-associated protein (TIGR03986 family)
MNLPKQIQNIPHDRCATAPYNFVELPEKIVEVAESDLPTHDRYYPNLLTGRIDCTLTTESPLYIRCGLTPADYADWSEKPNDQLTNDQRQIKANFFALPDDGRPIIPGSSLRGMLRSLVEIITYSKVTKISDRSLVYRAVADTSILRPTYRDRMTSGDGRRAGFMIKDGGIWKIAPALPIDLSSSIRLARIKIDEIREIRSRLQPWYEYRNAAKINVRLSVTSTDENGAADRKYPLATCIQDSTARPVRRNQERPYNAVLVESGNMPGKKKECIFGLPDSDKKNWIEIPDDLIRDYKNQITKEQEKHLGKEGVLRNHQPVFYLMDDEQLIFFGHAMMFRLPYDYSVEDFIPERLRKKDQLDVAESLFGMVQNRKAKGQMQQAITGRISISDARCQQTGDIWLRDGDHAIIPKILSEPKPTTFQHYLVQPDASPQKLKHYASEPENETVLRGHKLYWHQGRVTQQHIEPDLKDSNSTQHTQIKPIKPGTHFAFSINFQNLIDHELGALLWVLDIAQDPQYRLSLGMGKPLGMGAVRIEHQIYNSNCIQRYQKLFQSNHDQWETSELKLDATTYIAAFEYWMIDKLLIGQDFKKIPRIKTLLKMLTWKESLLEEERQQRSYMELEEFKQRKVLPVPQKVDTVPLQVGDEITAIVSSIQIERGTKSKMTLRYTYDDSVLSGKEEIYKFDKKGIDLKEGDEVTLVITEIQDSSIRKYKFKME